MIENPEGDDGFVTVTYKRKRGRNSGGNPSESEPSVAGEKKKRRGGAGELTDFYRFQVQSVVFRPFALYLTIYFDSRVYKDCPLGGIRTLVGGKQGPTQPENMSGDSLRPRPPRDSSFTVIGVP